MKKLLVSISLILSYGVIQAQGINFETGDWASVLKKAKTTNKLIFVDIYTTWCGPCKRMDKEVFSTKEVGDYFNKNFIAYKLDAEKGEGVGLSKTYNVTSFPNLIFVDGSGKLVVRNAGALNTDECLQFGQKALDSEKELTTITTGYNNGNRSPDFILKYLAFLKERDLPTETIMINYLSELEKQQWLSLENIKLIQKYIHTPYNNVIPYVVEQRNTFAKGSEAYRRISFIVDHVYNQYLIKIIEEKRSPKEINQLLSHANLKLSPKEVAVLNSLEKRVTAKRDQDWDNYIKYTISYVNTYVEDNYALLNNFAWAFYKNKNVTDKKALNEALGWVNKALQNQMDWNFLDTKAHVLYKMNRKEDALITANKAVKLAKQGGRNPSGTIKLIEKIRDNS